MPPQPFLKSKQTEVYLFGMKPIKMVCVLIILTKELQNELSIFNNLLMEMIVLSFSDELVLLRNGYVITSIDDQVENKNK